jgi:hypothetical protein
MDTTALKTGAKMDTQTDGLVLESLSTGIPTLTERGLAK